MKKVFVAGGVSYDTIIYLDSFPGKNPQTIFSKGSNEMVGSTGSGKALNLCRLDFETVLHSTIGTDNNGKKVKEFFEKENLTFLYDKDSSGTEAHTNLMDKNGGRISIYTSYATFEPQIEYERLEKEIEKADYVILNIINYVRNLIPVAKKYRKEIWCDIHDYDGKNEYQLDFIQGADYIFMSSDSMENYREFMEKLIKSGKKLVVCTHGKNGCTALMENLEWIEIPIIKGYNMVDTNGAGDSFFSGVLYGFSKGYDIKKCLQFGTIAGGLCVTSKEIVCRNMTPDLLEKEYVKYFS